MYNVFKAAKNLDNIIEACNAKLDKEPMHIRALVLRANANIKKQQFKNSLEDSTKLVVIDPNNTYFQYLRGVSFEKLEKVNYA